MAKNYYCLVAGLPDLLLGDKKVVCNSIALREELCLSLDKHDFEMAQSLYLPYDHYNVINLLFNRHQEFDPRGIYPLVELEKLVDKKNIEYVDQEAFPPYLLSFVKAVLFSEEEKPVAEAEVMVFKKYVAYLKSFSNVFLSDYIQYQINIKNVFVAMMGTKHDVRYEKELIGESEVVDALVKSRARDFGLGNEFEYMENLIQVYEDENLLERELKIDRLKWKYLDEATFFHYFTIERILAFVYKLLMVERWIALDEERGKQLFAQLVNELENSYEFPDEYKLNHGKKK